MIHNFRLKYFSHVVNTRAICKVRGLTSLLRVGTWYYNRHASAI